MGAYLSTPIRNKVSEDKQTKKYAYGASSMQGWRVSQEDAHNCCTDFDESNGTSLFAVYDGHGGAEVAQYTAMHFPKFLKKQAAYGKGQLAQALEQSFLAFDATLATDKVVEELRQLAETEPSVEAEEGEEAALYEEAEMPLSELMARYGGAQDGAGTVIDEKQGVRVLSPAIRSKRSDDKSDLKDVKTNLGISKLVNGKSPAKRLKKVNEDDTEVAADSDANAITESKPTDEQDTHTSISSSTSTEDTSKTKPETESDETLPTKTEVDSSSDSKQENGADEGDSSISKQNVNIDKVKGEISQDLGKSSEEKDDSKPSSTEEGKGGSDSEDEDFDEDDEEEDDDEEGQELGSSSDDGPESGEAEEGSTATRRRRQVAMRKAAITKKDVEDASVEDGMESWGSESDSGEEEEQDDEEVMIGGDEPGSDSGCTAVVALLKHGQLVVANAGDSRCVVSRGGRAIDMSVDHKPEDPIESNRISKAGGRVTADGRVNGGLNLSRALGDHGYKQNKYLSDKQQMITALPDIKILALQDIDDFMIIACDGVWNVMSSQEAVNFVKARLPKFKNKLSAICEEIFDFCIAPDTTGDGTGCDNMTCVIVTLDKMGNMKRSARDNSPESSPSSKRVRFNANNSNMSEENPESAAVTVESAAETVENAAETVGNVADTNEKEAETAVDALEKQSTDVEAEK